MGRACSKWPNGKKNAIPGNPEDGKGKSFSLALLNQENQHPFVFQTHAPGHNTAWSHR